MDMLATLGGFVAELRTAGLPVSLGENLDALEAVRHIPLEDRSTFKAALAATMVKSQAHYRVFDTVFEVYFSFRGPQFGIGAQPGVEGSQAAAPTASGDAQAAPQAGGPADSLSREQLAQMLYQALAQGDEARMRAVARQAVAMFAGMEPGRPVGGTYYLYRTLRNLDLDSVLEQLMQAERETHSDVFTPLEERLVREEYQSRIAQMRQEVEAEIRRRLVADRGADAVARTLRRPLPEDVDFMHASRDELTALRRAIQPLARKLAVRLARRRRHQHRGLLDFRRTIRASLAFGGVPAEPRFRHPRPAKPEIVVIADVSGSVAAFARFTLQFVYAISSQFSRVRSFVFIDGIDEVTRFFEESDDPVEAVHRINTEADVVWLDGHSDYGHAFEAFWKKWGQELTPKTSVLFLGDARNNYHASQSWVLAEVRRRVRHVYWLDPEPRSYWDTGDSIVAEYGRHCDGVFECRNLRQLHRFVEAISAVEPGRVPVKS